MGKTNRIFIIIAAGLVFLLAVGGYLYIQTQKQKKGIAGNREKVTIAHGSQPIAGLVYVAFAKGYFAEEGIDVALQPHTSGRSALSAVMKGAADVATVAETPIMREITRGENLYIIATILHADKNTAIVAKKDRGIFLPGDLSGKKVGVTTGSNGDFFLSIFLIANRIDSNKITTVPKKPEEMFDALVKGEVDAVSTWNPHVARLRKELGERAIIFYGQDLYTETYNIASLQSFVNKNIDTVEKLLRALIRAEKFVQTNEAAAQKIIAGYSGFDQALLQSVWDIYRFKVGLDQNLILTLEDQTRWVIPREFPDKKVPNYLNFIYLKGLETVKPEAVTIIR